MDQITDSTCGPTVMSMLLDFYHISVTQEDVIKAAGVKDTIEEDGMTLEQLALAAQKLAPAYTLWYKEDATILDIAALVSQHELPVAVNWQGFFYDSLEEEKHGRFLFHGHYSIVTDISARENTITIADPYYEFPDDRTFPIDWFKSRWWDIDEDKDPTINQNVSFYTSRLLFIVVPQAATFPTSLGLQTVAADFRQQKIAQARLSHQHHPAFAQPRPWWSWWKKLKR
jgi:hypothetical protein